MSTPASRHCLGCATVRNTSNASTLSCRPMRSQKPERPLLGILSTVNIRLYITLAHIVAPAPAMHSCGAPCWDVVHRPCRDPDRASNQARSRGSLSQTGWVSTVDRVGNASITDLIARETATSCALLTGSNAKTRQTRSGSLRLSQGRGPLTPPPPSPRPDLPPPLPRYVSA